MVRKRRVVLVAQHFGNVLFSHVFKGFFYRTARLATSHIEPLFPSMAGDVGREDWPHLQIWGSRLLLQVLQAKQAHVSEHDHPS